MKVTTNSDVQPQLTLDTYSGAFQCGEETAQAAWEAHCEGETVDESALSLAQSIMVHFVQLPREDATEFTFGVIRGLLRKSRKPAGTPANIEGGAQ